MVNSDDSGKPTLTDISPRLICLEPVTLRSAQMRASCFFLDAPIMGDRRYKSSVVTPNKAIYLHLGYVSFPSRYINKCYQIRSAPQWESRLFFEQIQQQNLLLPKAL